MPSIEMRSGIFVAITAGAAVMVAAGLILTYLQVPAPRGEAEASVGVPQDAHTESAAHAESHALQLDAGRRWATDAPLRQGMTAIRALVEPLGAGQRLEPGQGARVAQGIREQVNFLVANCKLAPQADATLHVLIGDLLRGAAELEQPGADARGVATIRAALALYPQYFDHPGWE